MRQLTFAALVSSITLAAISSATASPCKTPEDTSDDGKLTKYLRAQTDDRYDDLVFMFMDKDGKYDEDETIHVTINSDQATSTVPPTVLERASKPGTTVQVYHRNAFNAYIVPIPAAKMKTNFNPKKDCKQAERSNRTITAPPPNGIACDVVNLAGLSGATLLYDQAAKSCATYSGLMGKELTEAEEAALRQATQSFKNIFGSDAKLGAFTGDRKPAISKITYSNEKKLEIGESAKATKSSRPEKEEAGAAH